MVYDKYKILIVDDNPSFIKAFEVLLKSVLGSNLKQLDIANNGLEALEMAKSNTYDYIFMDVNMPEMNGIAATKIINRESSRYTNVIAISFNNDFETVVDIIKSGARRFINKANLTYDEVVKIFDLDM